MRAPALRSVPTLRIGTRGSALARRQATIVADAIRQLEPGIEWALTIIRTSGDEQAGVESSHFEGQGIFVRAIEAALLSGEIHLAVHSYKDMPSATPDGLAIAAFLARDDPRDALVTRSGLTLETLPTGARIGTGSPRRRALLLAARPDLQVVSIRGNVDTRLSRVGNAGLDGVVVAAAGLRRLGRQHEAECLLDPLEFVPAIGQGTLAVEVRADDRAVVELAGRLDHAETRTCALAERAVALAFGAGCQTPIGAYARLEGGRLDVSAFIATEADGIARARESGPADYAAEIGARIGAALVAVREGEGTALTYE